MQAIATDASAAPRNPQFGNFRTELALEYSQLPICRLTGEGRFNTDNVAPAKFDYNNAMLWTSMGLRKRLESDIRRDYPWLFQEYNAKVLPAKPYKQVLDYANVTVAVGGLLLQFTRGHGEFHVSVAPAHDPDDWYTFGEVIDFGSKGGDYTMSDFERLFRANIEGIKGRFSDGEYTRTSRKKSARRLSRP